jgi:hypothetical protein
MAESRINESVNFKGLADKHRMSMDECMKSLNRDYSHYQMTGECSDLLNSAMQIHRHHMEETAPITPTTKPGVFDKIGNAVKTGAHAIGKAITGPNDDELLDRLHRDIQPDPAHDAHRELDEIAKLAGITDEGAGIMHYKDEKAKEAGKDSFTLGDKTFPVKENFDNELANIIQHNAAAVEQFKQGGEMDYDLESDLWEYYFNKGEIRNYDADASEFISQRFAEDLGIDEGNAYGLAVQQTPPGEEIKIDGKPTGEIKRENAALNELARLAGLKVESNDDWHDSLDGEREDPNGWDDDLQAITDQYCDLYYQSHEGYGNDNEDPEQFFGKIESQLQAIENDVAEKFGPEAVAKMKKAAMHEYWGNDQDLDEADAPVVEPDEEPSNNAHKNKYQSMKGSTMGPGEGDAGEKRMYPKAADGDNPMTKPSRGMPVDGHVQEGLEARLAAEYESIKKSS